MRSEGSYLAHHGILGMKWGIRRFQNEDGSLTPAGKKRYANMDYVSTKNKETLTLARRNPVKPIFKNPDGEKSVKNTDADFDIYANGKKVGDLMLEDHGDELYVNWIGIKSSQRGKGYASSVMEYVVQYGQKNGYKYATLEVPGTSPDAKHVYEKTGFKENGFESEDDVWGGLTKMKRKL